MGNEIFQEAKRRIDRRRMNQQVALSARLDEIQEKVPEVIQVRRQLAMTSAEISKLILQKNTDIKPNKTLLTGPAKAVSAIPCFGFLKLFGLIGTGLA